MTFETFEELEVWRLAGQLKKESREKYISEKELEYFREKVLYCIKVLNGYIAYLKKQVTK